MKKLIVLFAALLPLGSLCPQDPLASIVLPPGFSIGLFAEGIPRARQLALSPDGTVFVGTSGDDVWSLRDTNGDFKADEKVEVLRGLFAPNGVAWHDGALYVAPINRVLKVEFPEGIRGTTRTSVVYDGLPSFTHHGYKYIRFGPDGKLYLPLGMPCNVCLEDDPQFGTIRRLNPDGSAAGTGVEFVARGVRNSVGFDWHPLTGELWFTDNGRDYLGDDLPPDELDRVSRPGENFGFPYVHGTDVHDPEFWARRPSGFSFTPPVLDLGPHVAALGMRFYTGAQFPPRYRNQIFIAEHGSWNRSVPIGYRITLVTLDGNKPTGYTVFADGFRSLAGTGRPVDLIVYTDGSLLVSDDSRGCVYRISYHE
jgi:glucose/arabinose dehydrogenase